MDSPEFDKRVNHLFPAGIEGLDPLVELALDMRSSWNHATDKIWEQLDPTLWKLTRNPWVVLQTVSRSRLAGVLSDPVFSRQIDDLVKQRRRAADEPAWFQENHPQSPLTCAAYFSMEFMLSEALPIYSGGLGNVAGDQLKTASDLGVPVVGVGLLYQQGYFRQVIGRNGAQQSFFPYNDPSQLPITPLREANGEWLRIAVRLPRFSVWLRAWEVRVGRLRLYLLDSNDAANFPPHRAITSELYGGGPELRLKQELVLGIGGWRLLQALGIRPEVCHLNEGHAAFAVLERARSFMEEKQQSFHAALAVTRAGNLFTTHTSVDAGFDRFDPAMIDHYLGMYASEKLGISTRELLALGRRNPENSAEFFNMAYLAVRGCGAVNGVSRLHGEVSRKIFQPLFSRWPEHEVPVGHVTNGVHMPTWDSAVADECWTKACMQNRWMGPTEDLGDKIRCLSDSSLWLLRSAARKSLVGFIRERLSDQLLVRGASEKEISELRNIFDANVLTIGFARRFAAYKRPTLLLHNPERLLRILTNSRCPVQLLVAGKAHPADSEGQDMIRQWVRFIQQPAVRKHAVFLSDYDMSLTAALVQGVDVWLNTPRRPWEASGTSGMKVLVNGGLNVSELDGWWDEAYSPEVGWALGDRKEHDADPAWDAAEADALYSLIEREIVPEFYSRNSDGIPTAWVARMRESMARLTPRFSANRTVREYTEKYYVPAARAYCRRAGDPAAGARIANGLHALERNWTKLRFGGLQVTTEGGQHTFEVQVYLNGLDPDAVRVELYADPLDGSGPLRTEMKRARELKGAESGYVYGGQAPASRPVSDYTPRIIPRLEGVRVPLESGCILWHH